MDIKGLFRRFRLRLLSENLIRSVCIAVLSSALATFLISFVFHILIRKLAFSKALLIFAALFLLSFLICFILDFPTNKKTARRIDEAGLKERISTMYAFRESTDFVARLQRDDAQKMLKTTASSAISLRIRKKDFLRAFGAVFAAFVMLSIPYDAFAKPIIPVYVNQEHLDFIDNLIEKLQKTVKEANNPQELSDRLYEAIDSLKTNLLASEDEIDNAASVSAAKNDIDAIMNIEISTDKISEQFEADGQAAKIAAAISDADVKAFSNAVDEIIERIIKGETIPDDVEDSDDETLADLIAIAIEDAVYSSGVSPENDLYRTLHNLASGISSLKYDEINSDRSIREKIKALRNEVKDALTAQGPLITEKDELDKILTDAKNELLGIKVPSPTPTPAPTEPPEEDPENPEDPEEPEEPENPEDPEGGGENPEEQEEEPAEIMTELIFDPYLGIVKYGEVFAAYYSDYLKALENGSVPEDLQNIMDKYFTGLSQ